MHTLLLIKSKVQLKDNTDGILLIIKDKTNSNESETPNNIYIAWVPLNLLNKDQIKLFLAEELNLVNNSNNSHQTNKKINLIINGLFNNAITHSSTVSNGFWLLLNINQIWSIEFKPPNLNGWWDGSIKFNLTDNLQTSNTNESPTLYLKDKLCPSTIFNQKKLNKSFDTFTNLNQLYWGGTDIINCLITNVKEMEKSKDNLNLWYLHKDWNNYDDLLPTTTETDNKPAISNSNSSWNNTKWSIMSTIATLTSNTTKNLNSLIQKHPIVKLINDNSNNVYIQKILKHPQVLKVQDDFDSAQIYLAKWSQGVKQEANRYQLKNNLENSYLNSILSDLGIDLTKDIYFTSSEINDIFNKNINNKKDKDKLNITNWKKLFNDLGQLTITSREIKDKIFHNGIDTDDLEIRAEIWPFLLGVYPWDSTQLERDEILNQYKVEYERLKKIEIINPNTIDPNEIEYWKDQIFRIEKDVLRNDRNLNIYKYNTPDGKPDSKEDEQDNDESSEQWQIKNPHLLKLREILIVYDKYNYNLGYVQGMCDLLSPIYYVLQDELMSFWCFVKSMEVMERNFLRDQSGIRDQMFTLTELTQLLLPQLSYHLDKCDSSDLFFCFRMLIVWFKREFSINEICSIWEIIWTNYYNSQFQLFFMLAILQDNSQSIIKNLSSFDQVIKYFNELHNTLNYQELMIRSELLYLTFQKLMNIMDRKPEMIHQGIPSGKKNETDKDTPKINESKYLRLLLSKQVVIQREPPRQVDSIK